MSVGRSCTVVLESGRELYVENIDETPYLLAIELEDGTGMTANQAFHSVEEARVLVQDVMSHGMPVKTFRVCKIVDMPEKNRLH